MKNNFFYLLFLLFALASCTDKSYKNASLSAEQRAQDLVSRLTLEEKVSLMIDASKPIERLGIKPYNWWNEALHGVARAGLATVFPQPIGMAASFDSDAIYSVFNVVSDEARAKNTYNSSQGSYQRYQGLTMWTPNINIFRDPRWGRGMETYGEDPYLTAVLGTQVVKGLQGPKDGKYDKLHACAKHFAVHSGPEWNRHSFNAENIKPRDLYETYLPAFETLVKEAGVKEVMCAYNRLEGDPCCGSDRLLIDILRNEWGYRGIVVSDCGAIDDFFYEGRHETHPDAASASAAGVLAGTDLECGSSYKSLIESVEKGLITEGDIDLSVKRLLKARFELGEMDDPEDVSWTKIPYSVVGSSKNDAVALDIARKSMTLLENKDNILPLKRGMTIAVMGPNANDSVMQWGNYNGNPPRTITILQGIRSAMEKDDKLIYEQGCSWIERTLIESVFDQCVSKEGPGFTARYWNNLTREGNPVTTTQVTTPFRFCTAGATVFAPGVNLTDFSATYNSTLTPEKTGDIVFEFYSWGNGRLLINGEEVKKYSNTHGGSKVSHTMKAEAGKPYDIQIDFEYKNGEAQLNFDLGLKRDVDFKQSARKVKDADVIIFAGGISPFLEGEEMGVDLPGFRKGDRTNIQLPQIQKDFLKHLSSLKKKIVFVNCSGSPLLIDPEELSCDAILQAWYPGQAGGKAVADVLFGSYNPAGRLPVTFYKSDTDIPDFEDYDMIGRTYRYMKKEALYPFGYGLSYTTFQYGQPSLSMSEVEAGNSVKLIVPVTNAGPYDGDEVVQVYLRKEGDKEGPIKTLRAFKRQHIKKGETATIEFNLTGKQFEWWDEASNTMRAYPGTFEILVGGSSRNEDLQKLTVTLL